MKPVMVAVDTTPAPIKTFLLCPLQAAHVFRKHANRNLAFSSLDSKDSHEIYAEFHESRSLRRTKCYSQSAVRGRSIQHGSYRHVSDDKLLSTV